MQFIARTLFSLATLLIAAGCFAESEPHKSKISFIPPPLEGTISLGIYDEWGQLIRVLHQEADFDELTVGPDALVTSWDGKDEDGFDVSPGTYHARGFVVGAPAVKQADSADSGGPEAVSIRLKLVSNPLEKGERATVDISVGLDDENVFIRSADGLPLVTIAPTSGATKVSLTAGRDNKVITVSLSDGANVRRFEVTGLQKMMAFDCGEIELK